MNHFSPFGYVDYSTATRISVMFVRHKGHTPWFSAVAIAHFKHKQTCPHDKNAFVRFSSHTLQAVSSPAASAHLYSNGTNAFRHKVSERERERVKCTQMHLCAYEPWTLEVVETLLVCGLVSIVLRDLQSRFVAIPILIPVPTVCLLKWNPINWLRWPISTVLLRFPLSVVVFCSHHEVHGPEQQEAQDDVGRQFQEKPIVFSFFFFWTFDDSMLSLHPYGNWNQNNPIFPCQWFPLVESIVSEHRNDTNATESVAKCF